MNKASGVDGIPVELFQILMLKCCTLCQQIWQTHQWTLDWKKSAFISIPKKGNIKECSNYLHNCTHLTPQQNNAQNSPSQVPIAHELRTSRCSNWIQKRHRNQSQIAICCIIEKANNSRKTSASSLLTMPKPLTVWITTNCGKFFKRWEYQATLLAS